jgi:hypothetical protein
MLEAVAEGDAVTDRTEAILFFGIYLMAQASEIRAFRPLCTIAAHDAQIERLIGDGVTEDLPLILARTYDGDPAPLRMLIEAADADEFARNASFAALSWLTATGRIDRDETARYLRDLHATLQPQDASWVWVGWQQASPALVWTNLCRWSRTPSIAAGSSQWRLACIISTKIFRRRGRQLI